MRQSYNVLPYDITKKSVGNDLRVVPKKNKQGDIMEYPRRKPMRIKDYDYSQNGAYFITICTHNRQELFETSTIGNDLCVVPPNVSQNQIIEKWLFELKNKFNITIDKYCIMSDHIHMILVIDTERHAGRSLPDMMQWFKTMTTNEYIKSVKENNIKPFDKKLWQKSYYDHIIRDENDYLTIWKYIEENPLKRNDLRFS